jgi:competence protein ComGE
MFWRNDGFFLSEMLLSLAAFLMGSAILLPIAIHIINQTVEHDKKVTAINLLYDELMYLKITGTDSGRRLIEQNGHQYEVVVTKIEEDSSWEVCIHYDIAQKQYENCAPAE